MEFSVGNYHNSYFDEVMAKNGVYEDMEYAGVGTSTFLKYDKTYEKNAEKINKSFQKWTNSYIKKDVRTTTTSEYDSATSYSASDGYLPVLIPIWVSPDIVNLSQAETPVYAMLPKIAVRGKFYDFNKRLKPSTNAYWGVENGPVDDYTDTYSRTVVAMKYAYARGGVTGQMQVHARNYIDMEREVIKNRTADLLQLIETEILAASASTNGFNGMGATISTNDTTLSASLALSDLRTSINYCKLGGKTYSTQYKGKKPNMIITNIQTNDDIKALLVAYLRYTPPGIKLAWGFDVIEFEGIPIVTSQFMTTTSTSKAIYIINTDVCKMAIALDLTMERLAKTKDANEFFIKWYGSFVCLNERLCAKITTIT